MTDEEILSYFGIDMLAIKNDTVLEALRTVFNDWVVEDRNGDLITFYGEYLEIFSVIYNILVKLGA